MAKYDGILRVDGVALQKKVTLKIVYKREREMRLRFAVAIALIRLAGWIANTNITVQQNRVEPPRPSP